MRQVFKRNGGGTSSKKLHPSLEVKDLDEHGQSAALHSLIVLSTGASRTRSTI